MHATAPTPPCTRIVRSSPDEIFWVAIVLAMLLLGAAYVTADIVEHTGQSDQQALAGGR